MRRLDDILEEQERVFRASGQMQHRIRQLTEDLDRFNQKLRTLQREIDDYNRCPPDETQENPYPQKGL